MELKGNFEALFLASILQLLCSEGRTGILKAVSGKNRVKAFVKQGAIICATATHRNSRLGNMLRRHEIISEEQLRECLADSGKGTHSLGTALFEKGYISNTTLAKFIHKQAEEIVFNMLLWESGDFEYKDCALNLEGMIITDLNVMKIIMGATRRIDEMSVLVKQIPNDNLLFKVSGRSQEKEKLELNSQEWYILSLVDGARTVRQIIKDSGIGEFRVYKILYSLVSAGLIEKM